MDYFNYFIKCLIRKFVNLLFKPKVLITFLIVISILCLLQITSRAEWTDTDITDLQTELEKLRTALIEQLNELEKIKYSVEGLPDRLDWINGELVNIREGITGLSNTANNINDKISSITTQLTTLNAEVLDIYNKLETNQKELLTELEADNKAVLEELNMIRDAINGSEEELTTFIDNGIINCGDSTSSRDYIKSISLNYESRYTYTLKIYYEQAPTFEFQTRAWATDNIIPQNYSYSDYQSFWVRSGHVPTGKGSFVVEYTVPSSNPKYIYLQYGGRINKIEVYRSIKGIVDSMNQSNDLQNQQNQLQQEQNNFLQQGTSDSDVSVDGFSNVNANDITSSGLTGIFNTIYSSITSWSSKDVVLPIPFTSKNIVIPANYTENMLGSFGGGWVINFVHVVYYFIVGRFMILSITNIVNSIKSGNILNSGSKNNITTDML